MPPAIERFDSSEKTIDSPATKLRVVTPNDDADLEYVTRGIYVGSTGDVNILAQGDSAPVVFTTVPAGTILPVRAKRVLSTSTSASDLVALI